MKDYQELKTPDGLVRHSHFFIEDKGMPKTRIEFYIFTVDEDVVELPNGWNVKKGDIVTAQAHAQDNYNEVSWSISKDSFFGWFNRVMLRDRSKYEIF